MSSKDTNNSHYEGGATEALPIANSIKTSNTVDGFICLRRTFAIKGIIFKVALNNNTYYSCFIYQNFINFEN